MRVQELVLKLLSRLVVYKWQWSDDDRSVARVTKAFLRRPPSMVIDKGGRCITCHRPEFLHDKDYFCLSRGQAAPFDPLMEEWHAAVDTVKHAYEAARRAEKRLRPRVARGDATAEQLAEAEQRADTAWGVYQAALRRMNRELCRKIAAMPASLPAAELPPQLQKLAGELAGGDE